MKDMVPKGTGNSRLLRSSIPENITHEELVALLRGGTFPVDFAGLNPDGIATQGSAYNKANVLPDSVCTSLGISTASEPKDAFYALYTKILDTESSILDDVSSRIAFGIYTGNGSKGVDSQQLIKLGFRPRSVFCSSYNSQIVFSSGVVNFSFVTEFSDSNQILGVILDNNGFYATWNGDTSDRSTPMLNRYGYKYTYLAIK